MARTRVNGRTVLANTAFTISTSPETGVTIKLDTVPPGTFVTLDPKGHVIKTCVTVTDGIWMTLGGRPIIGLPTRKEIARCWQHQPIVLSSGTPFRRRKRVTVKKGAANRRKRSKRQKTRGASPAEITRLIEVTKP